MSFEIDIDESSRKLSELDRLSTINDNDYLVFERGDQSYKMSYSNFKQNVYSMISSRLGLGTISSHEADEFAKFAHGHSYTDFWYYSSYGPSTDNEQSCYYAGKFEVSKYGPGESISSMHEISVYVPTMKNELDNQLTSYKRYAFGELVFINSGKMVLSDYLTSAWGYQIVSGNIDIHASSFNGFVVPNGTTFTCEPNEFISAKAAFAENGDTGATKFTVPNLTAFFKSCPKTIEDIFTLNPHQTVLLEHDHGGSSQSKYTYKKDNPLKINAGKFWIWLSGTEGGSSKKNYLHWGGKNSATGKADSKKLSSPKMTMKQVNINIDLSSATIDYYGNDEQQSYPDYHNIQVLMYIGEK